LPTAPEISEGNSETAEKMLQQDLPLPTEMKDLITEFASESLAWAAIVNIEYIKPFLNAKQNDAHMDLYHPEFLRVKAKTIKQSRFNFLGNSYVAIEDHDYHQYDHLEDTAEWYQGRGKKMVISLDHFGCCAITPLGDSEYPPPKGLKYRVMRDDELAVLRCKV
jgi:hypothetical protein